MSTYTPDLDGLIEFLRTKPGEESYSWKSVSGCAFGQFYTALGLRPPPVLSNLSQYVDAGHIAYRGKHTFGAALARAVALKEGTTGTVPLTPPAEREPLSTMEA